jgi:hypothetical protein
LVIRGIAGSTNNFRLIDSLGSPLISVTATGETTLHDLNANDGVVKTTGGVLSSGLLVDADVDAAAAIAGTKIYPDFGDQNIVTTGSVTSEGLRITVLSTGIIHSDSTGILSSSLLADADVGAAAAIAGTKIDPDFGSQNVVTLGDVSGGSLTTTGLSSLGGGQKVKLSSLITSNYVATTSDYILQVDTTGGTVTITLPSAATVGAGTVIIVKDASGAAVTNNITVAPDGADTIDGGTYDIIDTYASVTFVSDGTSKWLVI